MLIIRLQRTGTKNKPSFRIVLAQAYRAASKQAIEVLGHYNPKRKDFAIKDQERLKYWLGQHVSISPTVHNLLVEKKMLDEKKVKAWQPKRQLSAANEGVNLPAGDEARSNAQSTPATNVTQAEPTPAAETPAEQPQA